MRIDNINTRPGDTGLVPSASLALSVVGGVGVPQWILAGGVGGFISATTTSPTLATTPDRNQYLYRYTGPKEMQISMVYDGSTTGANNGSGDYLFTLPGGAQFDTGILTQRPYTLSVNTNDNNFARYAIPGGSAWFYYANTTTNWQMQPVVYDASRFRIMIFSSGIAVRCWSSSWYGVAAGQTSVQLNFSAQVL
jgi:hypothetical protein